MAFSFQLTLAQDLDGQKFGEQMGRVFIGIMLLVGVILLVKRIAGARSKR